MAEHMDWRRLNSSPKIINSLLTERERKVILARWRARGYLLQNFSYREVSRKTGLSLQTIRSIKKALEAGVYASYQRKSSPAPIPVTHRPSRKRSTIRTKYGRLKNPYRYDES